MLYRTWKIFILLFFTVAVSVCAQDNGIFKTSLTILDGLSHNNVTSIAKDHHGFMWFGTENGLNKYDGYNFRLQYPSENPKGAFLSPSIECLYIDSGKNMWIGTRSGGIIKYNLQYETYTQFPYCAGSANCVNDQRVISFCEDRDSNLWVGTWLNGMSRYDYRTGKFEHYNYYKERGRSNIGDIIVLNDGSVYGAGYFGLWKYNKELNRIDSITLSGVQKGKKGYVGFISLLEDTLRKVIWVGSWENGLIEYNYLTGKMVQHLPEKEQIVNNPGILNVYSSFLTTDGELLVGTWGAGLWKYDYNRQAFTKIEIELPGKQVVDVVTDIFEDENKILWISTQKNGIVKLNKTLQLSNEYINWEVSNPRVISATEDKNGDIFAVTEVHGMFRISEKNSVEPVLTMWGNQVHESYMVHVMQDDKVWVSGNCNLVRSV